VAGVAAIVDSLADNSSPPGRLEFRSATAHADKEQSGVARNLPQTNDLLDLFSTQGAD